MKHIENYTTQTIKFQAYDELQIKKYQELNEKESA
jgi:hypothetical protein